MARLAVAALALVASAARADPGELGASSRGRAWWDDRVLAVTPIKGHSRGGSYIAGWAAGADGRPIDHARFYELVGHPELARAIAVRRTLGVAAMLAGGVLGVVGARDMARDHGIGAALYGAGLATSFTGIYVALTADPISADQAQQLADDTSVVIGARGRF
jgi:hypothetical protein